MLLLLWVGSERTQLAVTISTEERQKKWKKRRLLYWAAHRPATVVVVVVTKANRMALSVRSQSEMEPQEGSYEDYGPFQKACMASMLVCGKVT